MRFVIASFVVTLLVTPAEARPRKHAHHAPAPTPVRVVPNDRAAQEHARAEAELADLRAGRVQAEPAPEPIASSVQENDRETPPGLRKSR
jgi:hypothetical protein